VEKFLVSMSGERGENGESGESEKMERVAKVIVCHGQLLWSCYLVAFHWDT
jgi:hypothetical protein